ncbi:MAG TPA: glycine cleavage system protein GcvH [Armatimonadota bacterium]|jgi:glycine cleavage system H protein
MNNPTDLKYSKTHEWVRVEADGTATIGITDHAQSELGDVIYLELPAIGASLTLDEPFGTVESVKAVSDLVAPLSGRVVRVNSDLVDAPEAINPDPYGCWLLVIEASALSEAADLLSAEDYALFTEEG